MDGRFTTLISFVIGILPTFGLLFAITSRYERFLEERDTMTSFIIGLFAGIPLAVAHMYFSFSFGTDRAELYLAILLLAPVEALAYQIYLNRKKFRDRSDIPFIALGFCLGASATYIGFLSGWMFRSLDADIGMVLGVVLFGLGVGPFKASVGLMMSKGNVKSIFRPDLLYAVLAIVAFNLFVFLYMYSLFLWTFALPISALGIALFYYQYRGLARKLKAR